MPVRAFEFQLVFSAFAIERLLFRLDVSIHAERFVLRNESFYCL